ncbi:hypothetical protein LCGC14_2656730, partial [marine sediment metagenome]
MADVEWKRKDPMDGDPFWLARLDSLHLRVSVPIGCPWFWEWSVDTDDLDEEAGVLAQGEIFVGEDDQDDDGWDYQRVELAQERCVTVARALIAGRVEPVVDADLAVSLVERLLRNPHWSILRSHSGPGLLGGEPAPGCSSVITIVYLGTEEERAQLSEDILKLHQQMKGTRVG